MTEVVTRNVRPKRDKVRMVTDDIVTANSLATHLGMTRQNVARLTAEAVIEQRGDGCYDQTASRLRYIKHLRVGASAVAAHGGGCRARHGQDRDAETAADGEAARAGRRADVNALIDRSAAWC